MRVWRWLQGWESQRAAMLAEIGTLKAQLATIARDTEERVGGEIADWLEDEGWITPAVANDIRSGAWRKP